ncbi:MAG: hypothetical protein J0L77_03495 [Alphaproteobacteria bacterium]|nr:hypothetical protein [Alphaproteobacteria bacterium]
MTCSSDGLKNIFKGAVLTFGVFPYLLTQSAKIAMEQPEALNWITVGGFAVLNTYAALGTIYEVKQYLTRNRNGSHDLKL